MSQTGFPKTERTMQRPSTELQQHWTRMCSKIILKSKEPPKKNKQTKTKNFFSGPIGVPQKDWPSLRTSRLCSTFRLMCYWSVWLLLPSSHHSPLCKAAYMKTTSPLKSFPSNQRRPERKPRLIALKPPPSEAALIPCILSAPLRSEH